MNTKLNHKNASLHITVIDTCSFIFKHSKEKKRMCDYHGQTNDISNNKPSGRQQIQVVISAVEEPGFLNLI